MAREGGEGANAERTLSGGEAETNPDTTSSLQEDESGNLEQRSDAEEDDPEAPPWNFLFVLPVALLVLVAIVGLVMSISR